MAHENRIDVHQHVVPPFWVDALDAHGGDPSGWSSPDWSPDAAMTFMDAHGIAKGILSLTAPSVTGWRGHDRHDMARRVNDYAAELARKRPDRFGNFATVPLPDIDGAVREAERALDELGADGVVLLTSYDGLYLGDASYAPLWDALDRRSATVFVHPGAPKIDVLVGIPGPVVDYPFDTTRSAVHMAAHGVLDDHPRTRIILSHAGGFLPYAAHRFAELLAALHPDKLTVDGMLDRFSRFHFDTALSTGPAALASLLAFARPDHVLFGSDFPYAPTPVCASFAKLLDDHPDLSGEQRRAINHGGADALFTRSGTQDAPGPSPRTA